MTAPVQTDTRVPSKDRGDELRAMTTDVIARLAEQISQGYTAEFQALLKYYGQLHRYSALNSLLLWCQRREATIWASYSTWKRMGRQVRKGARASWVWCPVTGKVKDEHTGQETQRLLGFKPGAAFPAEDLEGIEDNPLPPFHRPLPDDMGALFDELADKIRAWGISVELHDLRPQMGGYAQRGDRIVINRRLDSRNRIQVLAHECLHSVLHLQRTPDDSPLTVAQMELEADAAGWVIMHDLGLGGDMTGNYLVNYQITAEELLSSLNRIHTGVTLCRKILGLDERSTVDEVAA